MRPTRTRDAGTVNALAMPFFRSRTRASVLTGTSMPTETLLAMPLQSKFRGFGEIWTSDEIG